MEITLNYECFKYKHNMKNLLWTLSDDGSAKCIARPLNHQEMCTDSLLYRYLYTEPADLSELITKNYGQDGHSYVSFAADIINPTSLCYVIQGKSHWVNSRCFVIKMCMGAIAWSTPLTEDQRTAVNAFVSGCGHTEGDIISKFILSYAPSLKVVAEWSIRLDMSVTPGKFYLSFNGDTEKKMSFAKISPYFHSINSNWLPEDVRYIYTTLRRSPIPFFNILKSNPELLVLAKAKTASIIRKVVDGDILLNSGDTVGEMFGLTEKTIELLSKHSDCIPSVSHLTTRYPKELIEEALYHYDSICGSEYSDITRFVSLYERHGPDMHDHKHFMQWIAERGLFKGEHMSREITEFSAHCCNVNTICSYLGWSYNPDMAFATYEDVNAMSHITLCCSSYFVFHVTSYKSFKKDGYLVFTPDKKREMILDALALKYSLPTSMQDIMFVRKASEPDSPLAAIVLLPGTKDIITVGDETACLWAQGLDKEMFVPGEVKELS